MRFNCVFGRLIKLHTIFYKHFAIPFTKKLAQIWSSEYVPSTLKMELINKRNSAGSSNSDFHVSQISPH